MECDQYFPTKSFLVLTVVKFVRRGGGPLERQK